MFSLKLKSTKTIGITSFLIVISMFMSSCSLGSIPSRTSSDSSFSEETSAPSDPDASETSEEDSTDSDLKALAEDYLQILKQGDPSQVCATFNLSSTDVLPATYPCDKDVFKTLFTHMSYGYSAIVTFDNSDYYLNVDCTLPDIRGCVDEILKDQVFMVDACTPWILAMCEEYGSDEVKQAYAAMKNTILVEALRRINEGEYTESLGFSSSFLFHDNGGGKWLCKKVPDFVCICGRDNYMKKIGLINMNTEYMIIEEYGATLAIIDTITVAKYKELLELKKNEIIAATSEID